MQHEISAPLPLHGRSGQLMEEGWARQPYWRYERNATGASSIRIKEWDYFAVISPEGFAITFTTSNLGYAGLFAVCFVDLQTSRFWQVDDLEVLPLGRRAFPPTASGGSISFASKKLAIQIDHGERLHTLQFSCEQLRGPQGAGLQGEIEFSQEPGGESLSIATSWAENRKAFYYNTKVNCLKASGHFTLGGKRYDLRPDRDLGVLDWGRGVWTYRNTWYWSSASGYIEGVPFGFNLGYGFSDRSRVSENCLVYAGKLHKLAEVSFEFDRANWLKDWRVCSEDRRVELTFKPAVDRNSHVNFLLIASEQHQVFGHFTGKVTLDDGRVLELVDFAGFAEEVRNRW